MRHPIPAALRRSLQILCLASLPAAAALAQSSSAPQAPAPPRAAASQSRPTVERAWARETPAGVSVGAAYFTVHNPGPQADQIVGLRSPVSERAEIHDTRITDGIMQMRQLTEATVPAGGVLILAPGATHVMLIGLRSALVPGATVPLILTFRHAGEVRASAIVQALGRDPPGQ